MLLLYSVFLLMMYFLRVKSVPMDKKLCTSPECVRTASAILYNMNASQNPCDDFYNFACGYFKYEHPHDFSSNVNNGWFRLKQQSLEREAQDFITKPVDENEPAFVKEMKTFYRSCLNFEGMSKETLLKLFDLVGLPENPFTQPVDEEKVTEILIRAVKYLQVDTFFNVTKEADDYVLKPPVFPVEDEDISGLAKIVTETIEVKESSILHRISQMYEMIDTIKKFATANVSETEIEGEIMSLDEFQQFLDNESKNKKSKFNLISSPSISLQPNATFKVFRKSYFSSMSKFFDESNLKDIGINIWMISFKTLYPYFKDKDIFMLPPQDRKKMDFCSHRVIDVMDISVGYFMVAKLKEKTVEKIENMAEIIRKKLMKNVEESQWMEEEIKKSYKNFVENIESHIAFPKFMRSVETMNELYTEISPSCLGTDTFKVIEDNYPLNLQTLTTLRKCIDVLEQISVNAQFSHFGIIYIYPGIIQFPWYYLGLDNVEYGGLGFAIGHEFSHSLYLKYQDGSMSGKTLENMNNITSCLISQYSNYNFSVTDDKINGNITIDDDIADNSGLKITYEAYKENIKTSALLPGLEKYTDDQLFFLSYANIWCSEMRTLNHDNNHSPDEARVQVVLKNFKPFSDAWNCPADSKMNQGQKCQIWY